jgi:hypothetical protein
LGSDIFAQIAFRIPNAFRLLVQLLSFTRSQVDLANAIGLLFGVRGQGQHRIAPLGVKQLIAIIGVQEVVNWTIKGLGQIPRLPVCLKRD